MGISHFLNKIKKLLNCKRGSLESGYIPATIPTVDGVTLQSVSDVLSIKDGGVSAAKLASGLVNLTKEDSATGLSTTSTSEVELDSVTLPAGTFSANDIIVIVLRGDKGGGSDPFYNKIRIADGTNTFTSSQISVADTNLEAFAIAFISPFPSITTKIMFSAWRMANDVISCISDSATPMIANWITAELTISLRGIVNTGDTGHCNWAIYKLIF